LPVKFDLLDSPNNDARPIKKKDIDSIVIHYTGMKNRDAAIKRMLDKRHKVSAHWCIAEDGKIFKLVNEEMRAWHAGISWWRGRGNVNDFSIGIELVNPGHRWGYRPFPSTQMNALIELCIDIQERYPIDPRNVVGHSDIAPNRKKDPGELFNWMLLADEGIGLWTKKFVQPISIPTFGPGSQGEDIKDWQVKLALFGYGLYQDGIYGDQTSEVVAAFQRHFRQARIDGFLDSGTGSILNHLLSSF
tara:strand:- start:18014 stop:18751 length:738 start_codon:yes stop_codon:yes gene_type:complete